ncbi:MAG: sigma 54-interacting transcriptional regulator [Magnetococcales bacterium]|nr:sigma 54-interacting transcriptional regulator [Magnetococcales bacterium]
MDLHTASSFSLTRNAVIASQLKAIFLVSQAVAEAGTLAIAMRALLEILDQEAGLGRGAVTLMDGKTGGLLVQAAHDGGPLPLKKVYYHSGEGMVGLIAQSGHSMVVEQPLEEPRFVRRLGLMDPNRPFIGVPIRLSEQNVGGVLTAQPNLGNRQFLDWQTLTLETVANILAQRLQGSREIVVPSPETVPRIETTDPHPQPSRTNRGTGFDPRHLIRSRSYRMEPIFQRIEQAARWDSPVLIQGESGTGKELVAQAIHQAGNGGTNRPFVKVNCTALSDTLLESELFGHEKGAFTGAVHAKPGRFELADGGTLFLDEIGDISASFQSKLLRVLQEGEFERVGGVRTLRVQVRIITATNVDLFARVRDGSFRSDLFYRLFVLPIHVPALRERPEDIPLLTDHFLARTSQRQHRPLNITPGAREALANNPWHGNVRELENCLERAAVMSVDGTIDATLIQFPGFMEEQAAMSLPAFGATIDCNDPNLDEREQILAALEQAGWVQAKAARLLGMTPRQIAYRIRTLDIPMRRI